MCQGILKLRLLKASWNAKQENKAYIQHCWAVDFVSAWWSIQSKCSNKFSPVNFGTPNPTTLPKYLKHQKKIHFTNWHNIV
jgi:hypothetical protein